MASYNSAAETLFSLVQSDALSDLQELLTEPTASEYVPFLSSRDRAGRTPLMIAAANGFEAVAVLLLRHGADVSYVSSSRRGPGSALHEATAYRHLSMARMLLGCGAEPFQANSQGTTAMDLAISIGQSNFVRLFESQALASSEVDFRAAQGAASEWCSCQVMLCYHHLCPAASGGPSPPPQIRMLLFDKTSKQLPLKTKLWLDGSQTGCALDFGPDCHYLHLTTHPDPASGLYTYRDKGSSGWYVYLRPPASGRNERSANKDFLNLLRMCAQLARPVNHSMQHHHQRGGGGEVPTQGAWEGDFQGPSPGMLSSR